VVSRCAVSMTDLIQRGCFFILYLLPWPIVALSSILARGFGQRFGSGRALYGFDKDRATAFIRR
ncbi:hypothetical protein, partial [Aquicoccus sp.]|uniref:hypothetical protein n=1 Tax=Aquicoccus sp. TaxID=2055851 RepID=UPI003566C5FC